MLEAQIDAPGYLLTIFAAHLYPGYGVAHEQHRIEEVRSILGYMAPHRETSCLLMGDFNTVSPQDTVAVAAWPWPFRQQMTAQEEGIGREAIRTVLASGLTDCFRKMYPDSGEYPGLTLPAPRPDVRLDYSTGEATVSIRARITRTPVFRCGPAPLASLVS